MLNNKDKRVIALVVFGIAATSLVSAVLTGLCAGVFNVACYNGFIYWRYLIISLVGVAFVLTFFLVKNKNARIISTSVLLGVIFILNVIFCIVATIKYGAKTGWVDSMPLTILISGALQITSYSFAVKYRKAEDDLANADKSDKTE